MATSSTTFLEAIGHRARVRWGGRHRRPVQTATVALVACVSVLGLVVEPASADAPAQSPDDADQQLVERFAPIIMVKQQDEECDSAGEQYLPTSVDVVLDNPEVALRQMGPGDPVVKWAPGAADLVGLGEGFFLDFPGSALSPGCVFERDFRKYTGDRPATVYAHIVQQDDEPDLLVLQYWIYWYYNDWNNKHESDWEGISLLFEASSVEDALSSEPVEVGYSQHEGGERAEWLDDKLEREGDRPVVYSSAGSHASYFGSAVYLGRGASEGFGCDTTTGPSVRVAPEVVLLPDSVDDPDDPLAWVSYDGRWGERQRGPFNGPTGPAVKDRWLEPMPWFEELRSSSVVIPAGDNEGASVISVFCDLVERGSGTLIAFSVSPTRVLLGLVVAVLLVRFLVGRTDWSVVAAEPLRRRRRAGQIIRASGATYWRTPLVFILLGLLFIPAAAIAAVIGVIAAVLPFIGDVLALAQGSSGTNLFVAIFAGSLSHLAAYVALNSLVADYLRGDERGLTGVMPAARCTWSNRRALLGGFLRAYFIVLVLLVTVIGLPWAIRQLVRYQFIPHAVAYDGEDGAGSLRRSSELVRGRWLHTAVVIAVLNGIVFATAMGVSLLLLLFVTAVPLWLFSALVGLVFVFVAPLAAIATNLLYGDAVAVREHAPDADLVTVD